MIWDPWKALNERHHLVYDRISLPAQFGGAVYWPLSRYTAIFIDRGERRRRRRCLLAHELVHDERGGGIDAHYMPPTWRAVVRREEGWVNDTVADRLVPPSQLRTFCTRQTSTGEGVTPAQVAVEFDVTQEIAARALRRLSAPRDRS
jgi:hypothetical protein